MGILNGGRIFAVYSYAGEKPDELSFKDGDELTVIRRGDEDETEWWWGKKGDQLGYLPRNLFGVSRECGFTGKSTPAIGQLRFIVVNILGRYLWNLVDSGRSFENVTCSGAKVICSICGHLP